MLTTQPTQYIFCDFPFKTERILGRYALGVTLGYKPAIQSSGHATWQSLPGYYAAKNMLNGLYNAYTVSVSGKRYVTRDRSLFVEAELLYRHYWFEDKKCDFTFLEKSYSFNGTRTEWQDVYIGKFLLGTTYVFGKGKGVKTLLEPFFGISYRYKTYRLETRDGFVNRYPVTYKVEEGNNRGKGSGEISFEWPVYFQAGLRIGLGM